MSRNSMTPDKELRHPFAGGIPGPPTGGAGSPQPPLTEWVEIIEPRTKEHMYANLTTGECVWDPPAGVPVKKTNENQWWELFDQNTSRFYYYNATSQLTVWHRPANCDIIPLAKLQTLKQNTQVRSLLQHDEFNEADSEDLMTSSNSVTSRKSSSSKIRREEKLSQTNLCSPLDRPVTGDRRTPLKVSASSHSQTSPANSPKSSSRRRHVHSHHHHHRHHSRQLSQQLAAANAAQTDETDQDQDVVLRHKVNRRSIEDPAAQSSGKYYSVPHRGDTNYSSVPVSKQRSLEGDQFRNLVQHHPAQLHQQMLQQQQQYAESPSSISRSVSFMGGRHQVSTSARPQQDSPSATTNSFGTPSWRASFDSGGRRSVESTPQSSRRQQQVAQQPIYSSNSMKSPEKGGTRTRALPPPPTLSQEGPAIEGYCTPMINRKVAAPLSSVDRSDSGISSSIGSSGQVKSRPQPKPRTSLNSNNHHGSPPLQQLQQPSQQTAKESSGHLSISQLVDSGMSALRDGNGNNDDDDMKGNNNHKKSRRKDVPDLPPPISSKMTPLHLYILEQNKLSGNKLRGGDTLNGDRDSYVESEDDRGRESDDFADDEDDERSIAESSINGEEEEEEEDDEERYLSEPTYNNLDPAWLRSVSKVSMPQQQQQQSHQQQAPALPPPQIAPRTHYYPPHAQRTTNFFPPTQDVDAFSEEFDLRMRFGCGSQGRHHQQTSGMPQASSTMPRPTSHSGSSGLPHASSNNHFSSTSYQQNPAFPVPYEVLHPSLQRNAHSLVVDHATSAALAAAAASAACGGSKNVLSSSAHLHMPDGRPVFQRGSSLSVSVSIHSAGGGGESDIEKYAQDNLNVQKKGLFRKKLSVKDILSWSDEPIRKPLTCIAEKSLKKEAVESFRLVQIYMGDRKARQGMTVNSVALDIATLGYQKVALRDEIYVQLCKQTTDNPKKESLRRGWELTAICLSFFPPSPTLSSCLHGYISKHRDPALDEYHDVNKWPIHVQISHFAAICARRLERIGAGGRLAPRKPSVDDVDQSRLQIFRPSMFGGTLSETMEIQRDRFPQRKLPWILTALADQVIRLNGLSTEGIFRVPADLDEVNSVKCRFDQWEVVTCNDCHTAASLLKLWLRELYEPLVPDDFYEESITLSTRLETLGGKDSVVEHETTLIKFFQMIQRLPDLNRLVLTYLIHFLQLFARPESTITTKMDAANLATVFAPNCLRCPATDPSTILENTRKEMAFVKNLIIHFDTSSMEGVL